MRDPFGYGGDVFIDEFYGDLDCHRGQERFAKRLKVVEVGRNVCFGGGKGGGSSSAPDPNIGVAALKQAETGQEWLNFAKEQFAVGNERQAELDKLNSSVIEQQLKTQEQQAGWATKDRERYESVFQPLQDEFIETAKNYDSQERQDQVAAEARADVLRSSAQQREASQRQMAGMGVNPNSGRFQGIERAQDFSTALASAGAQNNARTALRDKAIALRADAVNMGNGLPAQSATAAGMGLNAGNSAVGNAGAAENNWRGNVGIVGQGFSGAMQGYGGMANTLQQQYNSQLSAWSAQQQANAASAAGLFSAVGTGIGLAFSSKKLKEDRKPAKDGLKAVNSMPIEDYRYKKGVADEGEHVGPMAEDFKKATGKGDGKTIALQDAIGVTMKAVQELDDKVEKIASTMPGLGRKKTENRRAA